MALQRSLDVQGLGEVLESLARRRQTATHRVTQRTPDVEQGAGAVHLLLHQGPESIGGTALTQVLLLNAVSATPILRQVDAIVLLAGVYQLRDVSALVEDSQHSKGALVERTEDRPQERQAWRRYAARWRACDGSGRQAGNRGRRPRWWRR